MPSYTYKCNGCGFVVSVTRSIAAADDGVGCPCGGDVRRVFDPPVVVFKGSGFYSTDGNA